MIRTTPWRTEAPTPFLVCSLLGDLIDHVVDVCAALAGADGIDEGHLAEGSHAARQSMQVSCLDPGRPDAAETARGKEVSACCAG